MTRPVRREAQPYRPADPTPKARTPYTYRGAQPFEGPRPYTRKAETVEPEPTGDPE